ncbi:MAG: DUF1800 domain-containing protein [Candidatus Acidiferrales bacterium]
MRSISRKVNALLSIFLLLSSASAQTRTQTKKKSTPSGAPAVKTLPAPASLSERQRAIHAVNRLTFGPRPGDVEKVQAAGVDSWIEDQLHPESINDSTLIGRLAPYRTLSMPPQQLVQNFPPDPVLRQVMNGKRPMPTDPNQRLIYAVNIARLKGQQAKPVAAADKASPEPTPEAAAQTLGDRLLALPKEKRIAALADAPPEQLVNFLGLLRPDERNRLIAEASPQDRETLMTLGNPVGVITYELQQAKVLRAVLSERQLQEVMADFWMNHFNVYIYKDADRYFLTSYERDVIRPRAFGKFRDLLLAVAQSPAMLFYLDNWLSMGPDSPAAGKSGQSGLNENYGRELMELHTLGVDGGYTQTDVTTAAKILTGWTITDFENGGRFTFEPRRHEPGNKVVLGHTFYDSGMDEGVRLIDFLAHNPATAHFISKKLAQRFVADDPPESLVKQMAATFLRTDGDIREVLRTMFRSKEFWSPKYYRGKFKTPLEFIVSTVRASGANVVAPDPATGALNGMGMLPYNQQPPTGYSMLAEAWDNQGDLLARFNFATTLTQNKFGALQFDPSHLVVLGVIDDPDSGKDAGGPAQPVGLDAAIQFMEQGLLPEGLSDKDQEIVHQQLQDPDVQRQAAVSPEAALRLAAGYMLASPEFQKR